MSHGSWGIGPWGVTPWGGLVLDDVAPPVAGMRLVLAEAIRENVVRLTFDQPVYYSRWHDPPDASFVDRYAVIEDPTAVGIDGERSRPVAVAAVKPVFGDKSQLDVWLDRALSPTGSLYVVAVTNLKSADLTATLDPSYSTFAFSGVRQGLPIVGADNTLGNRDIANPQMPGVGIAADQLGHFTIDDTGDYGIDQGLAAYKKRVFRRLMTRKNAFRHLLGYGVGIPQQVKRLARAHLTDSIAADAEDQIRQEPETQSVSVSIQQSTDNSELFVFRVRAKTSVGDVNFDVPLPV